MSLRLGTYVEGGFLINRGPWKTHGRVKLRGLEVALVMDLTGNTDPDLAMKEIRFEARPHDDAGFPLSDENAHVLPADLQQSLPIHQVGTTGTMTFSRRLKVPDCPMEEVMERYQARLPITNEWKRCLTLEWFSQNGRVVIELADPEVEMRIEDSPEGEEQWVPLPEPIWDEPWSDAGMAAQQTSLEVTTVGLDDEGNIEITKEHHIAPPEHGSEEDGGSDLDRYLAALTRSTEEAAGLTNPAAGDEEADDFIRELELMDDLIDNDPGVQLRSLLSKEVYEHNLDDLSDEVVDGLFKAELSKLALFGIALHLCEHFDARKCLRLLMDKLGREGRPFPQLAGTGWVQNYMTSESCPECEAEFERQYEEDKASGKFDKYYLPDSEVSPDDESS